MITSKVVIAWVQRETEPFPQLAIVHSQDVGIPEASEAWERFEAGGYVDAFVPIVFLDDKLDTPAMRSLVQDRGFQQVKAIS